MFSEKIKHRFFDKTFTDSTHFYITRNPMEVMQSQNVVEANRRAVTNLLDASGLVIIRQVHGNVVHIATEPSEYGMEVEADASVTNVPGLVLGIQTADCVPVLFACKSGKVIGAAHAGWKSAKADIVESVAKAMRDLGAGEIDVMIGPAIQHKSYEVSDDYREAFLADEDVSHFFIPSPHNEGKWMFDLPGFVTRKVKKAGLNLLHKSDDDTYTMEHKYHSYRRDCHRGDMYQGNLLSTIVTM